MNRRLGAGALTAVLLATVACRDSAPPPSAPANGAAGDPPRRPNILLVVADDVGFTDLGAYGGEIRTPVIDRLAERGLKFSRFRASPVCSPTRASLLSGADPHLAGLGNMFEDLAPNQQGQPGYEGHLNDRVAPLPAVLKRAGYRTYMTGKWHLGRDEATSPKARGFDRSFALLPGGGSHFADRQTIEGAGNKVPYREDGRLVNELPADFYSTRFFADRLMQYIGERPPGDEAPFFAYLAFTAPHFPLQAPDESLARYRGAYDSGYDALFDARLAAAKRLGVAPANAVGAPRYPGERPWTALSPGERAVESRRMEILAAMISDLDTELGRVLEFLRGRGDLGHTIVVFMSDNGAEGHRMETDWTAVAETAAACCNNTVENMGRPDSYVWLGPNWARASSAPFRLFKGYHTEGGIRVPFIISYPGLTTTGLTDARAHVSDIMPTLLDLAGVAAPGAEFDGRPVVPMTGVSLRPLLDGTTASVRPPDEVVADETFGKRFVAEGNLKALLLPRPFGTGAWQLYQSRNGPLGGGQSRGGPSSQSGAPACPLGPLCGAQPNHPAGLGLGLLTYVHTTATGRRLMPEMKFDRSRATGPSRRMSASAGSNSSNSTRISSRARCSPRHLCGLFKPKARCSFGAAAQVEFERPREVPVVEVAGDEPDEDLVAGLDRRAAELGVAEGGAAEVHGHGAPAQHLFDRGREKRRSVAQPSQLGRPLQQREHSGGNRVAGRVVAGRHQQGEEVLELVVGERRAVARRPEEQRNHVVGRVLAAPAGLFRGVGEQLEADAAAERHQAIGLGIRDADRGGRELGVGVADERIAAAHQPRAVGIRHAQQRAEHAHRQLPRQHVHEVEGRVAAHVGDQRPGHQPQRLFVRGHFAKRERRLHEPPERGVRRRIELHHRPAGGQLVGPHVLDADTPRRRVHLGLPAHRDDVVVARDGPQPDPSGSGHQLTGSSSRRRVKVACGTPRT